MSSTLNDYKFVIILFLLVLIGLLNLQWIVWGGDGLYLWAPIIAEYLRDTYETSTVIFGGQNLAAVYGELPFWKPFLWLKSSPILLLNFTYLIVLICFYVPTQIIFNGLSNKSNHLTRLVIFLYCLLSPIILNRVYPGHFNLLFGMLPLLICLAQIYHQSRLFDVFSIFCLVCAFSIQGYQILAYHIFYIPVLLLWVYWTLGRIPKSYVLRIFVLATIAFVISWPVFHEMLSHSKSATNLRNTNTQVVYSYLISNPLDVFSLIMSSVNPFTSRNAFPYFHELNYPIGLTFLSIFFLKGSLRKIMVSLFLTLIILFAFSANWPVFNLFSDLPIIKSFRVPQRSMMLACYILPLFCLVWFKEHLTWKSLLFLLCFILVGNGVPYFEVYCLMLVLVLIFLKKWENYSEIVFGLIFSSLFLGLPLKYVSIRDTNEDFENSLILIKKADKQFALSRNKIKVHLIGANPISLMAAANYIGVPTAEGYGHPPKDNFLAIKDILPIEIYALTNVFSLKRYHGHPKFEVALTRLGVGSIILMLDENDLKRFDLKTSKQSEKNDE